MFRSLNYVVLLVIGLILAGCAQETVQKKKTLRFMYYRCKELDSVWKGIVADFEEDHPGIKVRMEILVNQTQLQTQMAGNSAPDVIYIASKTLADFGTRGMLLDLRPFIKRDSYDINDILEVAL